MSGRVLHMERCPRNAKVRAFLEWWNVSGPFAIVVLRGTTTDELQEKEYAKGRSKLPDGSWVVSSSADVVTRALRAADSAHGHEAGADCHPVREFFPNGAVKLIWLGSAKDGDAEAQAEGLRLFAEFDRLAREHGLEAGDRFPGICDRPHIQDPDWRHQPLAPGVS